jgi:sensor histidine kinase YesM
LNDVLSNANNHAFSDFDLEKNKVDIFISVIENHLHLLIANNGTSFPENFDQSKFVQKYQKAGDNSGAGIGGYDINRITQYFNGTFTLITEPIDGYNTVYQFIFTVLDLKEEINE